MGLGVDAVTAAHRLGCAPFVVKLTVVLNTPDSVELAVPSGVFAAMVVVMPFQDSVMEPLVTEQVSSCTVGRASIAPG